MGSGVARARDALGREVVVAEPPRRIVSLVPSETETVAAIAGLERLVGRTQWCEEPAGAIESVPTVGGTKHFDVARVIAIAPDLVLANQEENGRADVERLIAAGLAVFVSFPRSVREALAHLETTARLLHLDPACVPAIDALRAAIARAEASLEADASQGAAPVRVFVPIWRDPWMSFDERTYASDLLRLVGAHNVFANRPRRYPLAADLGRAPPQHHARGQGRDTRYPRFDLQEVQARAPELVLLPDEPYRFGERDRDELRALLPGARIEFVSGKDLFWYGVRAAGAIGRIAARIRDRWTLPA